MQLKILRQPDPTTCGPTCLHALYRFYGDEISLPELITAIQDLEGGGTLGVFLANHALVRRYSATILTWNLNVFDPTWFAPGRRDLAERLAEQHRRRKGKKIRLASRAYMDFLEAGGRVRFEELEPGFLLDLVAREAPLLAGVSATALYRTAREREGRPDDVRGRPVGHFVVLRGADREAGRVFVADPFHPESEEEGHYYQIDVHRFLTALLLGVVTYDANLILLRPRTSRDEAG